MDVVSGSDLRAPEAMEKSSGGAVNYTQAQEMLSAVAATLGRKVHVFVNPAALPLSDEGSSAGPGTEDEPDEYYEFTAADYAQVMAYKKQDVFLKTRKLREEEEAAKRARITKACIRVQFPDNFVLEAVFHPSDPVSLVTELLKKVILHPNLAFYLYTTPPKQVLKDLQQSMYSAGLAPGGIVYFSYEVLKGKGEPEGPYLRPEIVALRDLHLFENPNILQEPNPEVTNLASDSLISELSSEKKEKSTGRKPKWFKPR